MKIWAKGDGVCACDCDNCLDGNCQLCDNEKCDDSDCVDCPMQQETSSAAERERLRLQYEVLKLKKAGEAA